MRIPVPDPRRTAAAPAARRPALTGPAALQRLVGNRATARMLARAPATLKEKVEAARRTGPHDYVLKAVAGMAAGAWTFEERAAEIVWRMIWMFLPERISNTLVRADPAQRGVELAAGRRGGTAELVVGPDFVAGITRANLDRRVAILRLVLLGKDAVIERLKADFGFADVVDGSASWTTGELAATHAGLSEMPAADRSALAGVTLRRAQTVTEHGQRSEGEFRWHVSNVGVGSSAAPQLDQTLELADDAFVDPDKAAWVAVHEAAHAVESDRLRRAQLAAGTAVAANNTAVDALTNATRAAAAARNAAVLRASSYLTADKTAASSFIAKVTAAHVAIDALAWGAGTDKAAADAVAARDAARAKLPKTNPADGDFATACELQDDWLAAARTAVSTRAARKRTVDAEAAARAPGNRSRRLQAFVDVVTRNGLAPVTQYARTNWPAHPEEFFADAYSMWRNDPARLPKPLKSFFDAGGHRS